MNLGVTWRSIGDPKADVPMESNKVILWGTAKWKSDSSVNFPQYIFSPDQESTWNQGRMIHNWQKVQEGMSSGDKPLILLVPSFYEETSTVNKQGNPAALRRWLGCSEQSIPQHTQRQFINLSSSMRQQGLCKPVMKNWCLFPKRQVFLQQGRGLANSFTQGHEFVAGMHDTAEWNIPYSKPNSENHKEGEIESRQLQPWRRRS